jgi:serine/threonine protein kinase
MVHIVHKIHICGFSHQDLKLDNFMLTKQDHASNKFGLKLIDFENGSILTDLKPKVKPTDPELVESFEARYNGSVYFRPPWIKAQDQLTAESLKAWDVYSLGASLYMLIVNQPTFSLGEGHTLTEIQSKKEKRLKTKMELDSQAFSCSSNLVELQKSGSQVADKLEKFTEM